MNTKRTDLIQRLTRPMSGREYPKPSPAYRDAVVSGQKIPEDIWAMREGVFGFDYMGSAEFEFGAAGRVLRNLAEQAPSLGKKTIRIEPSDVIEPWDKKSPTEPVHIRILALPEHMEHAEHVIRTCAKNERSLGLKERTYLAEAIVGGSSLGKDVGGWLELDNGFFFFTDKVMASRVRALLGIGSK